MESADKLSFPKRQGPGDLLVVLGDEDPERAGIALVHGDSFLKSMEFLQKAVRPAEADKEDNNL